MFKQGRTTKLSEKSISQLNKHNNRMQSDKLLRYAPRFAADARRYVASTQDASAV